MNGWVETDIVHYLSLRLTLAHSLTHTNVFSFSSVMPCNTALARSVPTSWHSGARSKCQVKAKRLQANFLIVQHFFLTIAFHFRSHYIFCAWINWLHAGEIFSHSELKKLFDRKNLNRFERARKFCSMWLSWMWIIVCRRRNNNSRQKKK